jgi:hypothetical protein
MIYKHSVAINKPWIQTGVVGFSFAGVIAKLRNAISIEIPVGYQDETGFHTGVKSATKEDKWPNTW